MSIEKEIKERRSADLAVISTLSDTIARLREEDIYAESIILGGTLMMGRGQRGTLIVPTIGRFGKPQLLILNEQIVSYKRAKSLERETPSPWAYHVDLKLSTGVPFKPFADIRTHKKAGQREFTARAQAIRDSHNWPYMVQPSTLPEGRYSLKTLATYYRSAPVYSSILAHEIASEKYPNGIGFDSNEIYDRGPVFAAVVTSYLVPKMIEGVRKIAEEKAISFDDAFREAIFVVAMGTDKETDVETFLDLLGYFTGATFIVVGANSPFGEDKGDAETNLADIEKVAKLIHKGLLPRGAAYSIADRLVMQSILMKMDPSARGLKKTVRGSSGMIYDGTFLAAHAEYIDKIDVKGWPIKYSQPRDENILWLLGNSSPKDKKSRSDWNTWTSRNAADFTRALLSSHRSNILYMHPVLPYGTRVLIVEGGGEANGPAQAAEIIRQVIGQQWSRTNRMLMPTVVIASEAGIPFVSDKDVYDASLKNIERVVRSFRINSHVVNAKGLPGHAVEFLADLLMYPRIVEDIFDPPFDREFYHIEPAELQTAIDDYGKSRKLKGF